MIERILNKRSLLEKSLVQVRSCQHRASPSSRSRTGWGEEMGKEKLFMGNEMREKEVKRARDKALQDELDDCEAIQDEIRFETDQKESKMKE